jgi:hypothetical protein
VEASPLAADVAPRTPSVPASAALPPLPAVPAPPRAEGGPSGFAAPGGAGNVPVGISAAPSAGVGIAPTATAAVAPGHVPSSDQSIEARMDRLEKMVADIAAAVSGRGAAPATLPPTLHAYAVPGKRWALTAPSNSVADMKKRRVDLEVQIDAMREQLERMQEEMQKLDDAISEGNAKKAKGDLPKSGEQRR